MSKKEKKKQRQIYASAVSPLEKGGALWERSINPPRSRWHPMRHRCCSVSPRPEGCQGSGMLQSTAVHLPLAFFPLLCFGSWSSSMQRAVRYEPVNAIDGGEAPSRWSQRSCAVKSEWISCGCCLQSDAARLLWCCDSTPKPLRDSRRAPWRITLDFISVLLFYGWWDFAMKSGLFSYKQTSITAPTRVLSSMLIYLIIDCEISLIIYFLGDRRVFFF